MKKRFWILILILFLVACTPESTPTPEPATDVPPASPTATATLTPSPIPPSLTPTETSAPTATATPTEAAASAANSLLANYPAEGYGPLNFPANINPLTGLPVADPAILARRPVAVKISNYPRDIRPQWGLSLADQVFEYYHEGGLTRLHAIFYGTDAEQAGPIRSARFTDEQLVRAYKSVFAFGSADERVRWRLFYFDLAPRMASVSDYPCPPSVQYPLCRTDPDGWNHLLTDTSLLSEHFTQAQVENGQQNLEGLYFNLTPPPEGQTASSVIVRYSADDYHKWVYDSATGRYTRYHDAAPDFGEGEVFEPLSDRLTGELVAADNVVVLLASHSFYSRQPEMIEINLIGFGKAYLFRDGQAYLVNWVRTTQNDVIALIDDEGNRFPLRPGNTWFEIIGQTSPAEQESPDWRFKFTTP